MKLKQRRILYFAIAMAVQIDLSSVHAIDVTVETFGGTGPHSTFSPAPPHPDAISGLDEPFWVASNLAVSGAFDGVDSFDIATSPPNLPFLTRINPGPGDLYQSSAEFQRSIGAGLGTGFTAIVRIQDVVPGTAATNTIQTHFNFGNELGSNNSLFELVGGTYDATNHSLQGLILIDAGVTKVVSNTVSLGDPTGNPVDIEFRFSVGADTVNGGSFVRLFGSADGGPLHKLLVVDGLEISSDLTSASNIIATMLGAGAQFVPVMDPDPMVTGPSLALDHFEIEVGYRAIPEPSALILLAIAGGILSLLRSRRT